MADYGTDLSCVADIDANGFEVSGRLLLGQALSRRLSTPRGRLLEDANYGYDLSQFLNDDLSGADLGEIRTGAEAECLKDERVFAATAAVTLVANVLIVSLVIQDGIGPFPLVLSISAVTTTVLTVGQ